MKSDCMVERKKNLFLSTILSIIVVYKVLLYKDRGLIWINLQYEYVSSYI